MIVPHPEDENIHILTASYCSLRDLFPLDQTIELDMGCGSGSYTTQLAAKYPERKVFASDVMIGRLRKLVKRNIRENVDNISALRVESRHLLGYMIPDACIDRLHLLCPDPWPKDKHRANRLMASDFVTHIARILKPYKVFHFSSDDAPYFDAVVEVMDQSGRFVRDDSQIADLEGIQSDFERRWLAQGKPVRHAAWRVLPAVKPAVGH